MRFILAIIIYLGAIAMCNAEDQRRAWSLVTKSHKGVVSVIRDLTLNEAKQIYERLDPWYGSIATDYKYPDGSHGSGESGRIVQDGDIEMREVLGPPDWDRSEINKWQRWPKFRTINVDKDGKPIL